MHAQHQSSIAWLPHVNYITYLNGMLKKNTRIADSVLVSFLCSTKKNYPLKEQKYKLQMYHACTLIRKTQFFFTL